MLRLHILIALTLLALAACGGGGQTAEPADVNVEMREWSVTPSKDTLNAGQVRIRVRNTGTTAHDFVIIKSDLPSGQLPQEGGKAKEDNKIFGTGELAVGQSRTVTVNLEPGKYIFICNVAGHYPVGMHVSVTVR